MTIERSEVACSRSRDIPPGSRRPRVAVLIASHNRREKTLRCLSALTEQNLALVELRVFLVDDCSTDGTGEAVLERFPEVEVIQTRRPSYWARSMAIAEDSATSSDPDFLLWLNDDTVLFPTAVNELMRSSHLYPEAIVVGAIADDDGLRASYGGMIRLGRHPLRFRLASPCGALLAVDAFNGNCVLIPRAVFRRVGRIDGTYAHAYADLDYSARAGALGVSILLTPGFVGRCRRDNPLWTPIDIRDYWRWLRHPKGRPWRSHARYLRRYGGLAWPATYVLGYLRVLKNAFGR